MAQQRRREFILAGTCWWLVSATGGSWSTAHAQHAETPSTRGRRALDGIGRALRSGDADDASETERRATDREMMQRAQEQDAREVEEFYSTRPIGFRLGKHEYEIPHNYFSAKDYGGPQTSKVVEHFGFFLFLPDYGGYTKENWRDYFDRRRIYVVEVRTIEKIAMGTFTDGSRRPLDPNRFDPRVRFERTKSSLEAASTHLHGLTVYRYRGGNRPGAVWTGNRSNGEFFWFRTSLAPGEFKRHGYPEYPSCDVRYYSEKEDLSIVYRYSQDHIAKWREIDDAIWHKIHQWRIA